MKNLINGRTLLTIALAANVYPTLAKSEVATNHIDNYKVDLFFGDSTPYQDELTLEYQDGHIKGMMHVPNDFDAPLEDAAFTENVLTFHITLPAKYDQTFPGGLFYNLQFRRIDQCSTSFCPLEIETSDFIGTVEVHEPRRTPTSRAKITFVGYLIGFKKDIAP
jgi:hypothetical protein